MPNWPKSMGRIASGVMVAAALGVASAPAMANPTITAVFDPAANGGAGISPADQTTILNALAFYNTNITSTFSTTIDFSTQSAGGASSIKDVYTGVGYGTYYSYLAANAAATLNPVQTSAVASLPNATNNPVTGTGGVAMTTTLALVGGIAPQISNTWSQCGGLTGIACITLGTGELGQPGLLGVVQHEIDEVLGTSSNLPNGGGTRPANPSAADLFRYSAPGVRSFALNTSKTVPCTGTPTAYFSVNGGNTNLSNYNNCNNGGDYGDWGGGANTPAIQVQDAFGNPSNFTSLTLAAPEVALLEAVGYNFVSGSQISTPEPATIGLLLVGLAGLSQARRRRRD